MPKKVSVKPILELRAAGISMRKIESEYFGATEPC